MKVSLVYDDCSQRSLVLQGSGAHNVFLPWPGQQSVSYESKDHEEFGKTHVNYCQEPVYFNISKVAETRPVSLAMQFT